MDKKAEQQYKIEKSNDEIIDELINQISRHTKDINDIIKLIEKVRNYRSEIYAIKLELKHCLSDIYSKKNSKNLAEIREQVEQDREVKINTSITNFIENIRGIQEICNEAQNINVYPTTMMIKEIERILLNKRVKICFECTSTTRRYIVEEEGTNLIFTSGFGNKVLEALKTDYIAPQSEPSSMTITPIIETKGQKEIISMMVVTITDESLKKLANGEYCISRYNHSSHKEAIEIEKRIEDECIKIINTSRVAKILQYYEQELSYWQEIKLKNQSELGDTEAYLD